MAFIYPVPEGGAAVDIDLYSVSGRRVAELAHGHENAGRHVLRWAGRNLGGQLMSPGVYFLRAQIGPEIRVSRVLIVR